MDKRKQDRLKRAELAREIGEELCDHLSGANLNCRTLASGRSIAIMDGRIEFKFEFKINEAGHFLMYYAGRYGHDHAYNFKQAWADRKGFITANPNWMNLAEKYITKMINKYKRRI